MFAAIPHATVRSLSPPSEPRLVLAPIRAAQAVLDGGWWPRSWDAAAELPGLILVLSARYGQVRQMMLNGSTWNNRFHRLAVGARVVRMGWFASLDPALAIVTTDAGDQVDVLIVPPFTPEAQARRAMAQAADPTNTVRAPAIIAAVPTIPDSARATGTRRWHGTTRAAGPRAVG